MDFGIALAPGVDAWKVVRRAEQLGFTHAWFYDTQMLCADVFVAMALAALGRPERAFVSARTSVAEVPLDWTSWRVLELPARR